MPFVLSRPKLLTIAARAGAAAYRRERDLSRILPKVGSGARRKRIVAALAAAEEHCESERKTHAVAYSPQRHVGLLAALFAETRSARA